MVLRSHLANENKIIEIAYWHEKMFFAPRLKSLPYKTK